MSGILSRLDVTNPLFAALVPIILRRAGYGPTTQNPVSKVYNASLTYVKATILIYIMSYLGRISRNNWVRAKPRTAKNRKWRREIIVIAGGTGGLGMGLMKSLVRKGAKVALLDVKPSEQVLPTNAIFVQTDVTKAESIKNAGDQVRKTFGAEPTILINAAGLFAGKAIIDYAPEEVQKTIDVNLTSHFLTVREFLPAMIKAKEGHVVIIASGMCTQGLAKFSDYAATKRGLIGFHESLRGEIQETYKTPAIRTSLIFPSFFRSPLTADWPEGGASALLGVIAPMIDLQPVVDRIVAGIEKDQGEDVVIPSHMTSLHATSTTAPWLIKDWMVKQSRAHQLYDIAFTARGGIPSHK